MPGEVMSVEVYKDLEEFLRSMRQAFGNRDMKAFRTHFWTDKRFMNLDASGRIDEGWGAYEEVLDQEFRYSDSLKLELRDTKISAFGDDAAAATSFYKLSQIDPEGRAIEQSGRVTFTIIRMADTWKIVNQHFSPAADPK